MLDLGWIQTLDADNFLAMYDVLIDIQKELNVATLGDSIDIPLMPQIIKFTQLFPGDSIGMRDQYCEIRWKAVKFLQHKSVIQRLEIDEGNHRWENRIVVTADPAKVSAALASMGNEYKRRTGKSAEAEGSTEPRGTKVFLGHGRSDAWRELKDFLQDRLKLDWVEFNREPVAGLSTKERLEEC